LSGRGRGRYGALQRIQVECKTCDVTESFYSNLSVEQFKLRHHGHEIVGREEEDAQSKTIEVNPDPSGGRSVDGSGAINVVKVLVDLETFLGEGGAVVHVRGFREDLEEAFDTTSPLEHRASVREMLESGEYVDRERDGLRFVWGPDAIEYGDGARERLTQPSPDVEKTESPLGAGGELSRSNDDSSVESAKSTSPADSPREEAQEIGVEPAPVPSSPPPVQRDVFESPSPPSPPMSRQQDAPVQEAAEAAVAGEGLPAKYHEKKLIEIRAVEPPARPEERKEDEYLLVSKSWYIQGGEGNRKEAVRVSKVLRGFRWKVEPVYAIGVMLDDILSIETSKDEISRKLIEEIESSGYRLTAITSDKGKPVAWFKRVETQMLPLSRSPEVLGLWTAIDAANASVEKGQGAVLEERPSPASRAFGEAAAKGSPSSRLDDIDA
jgi:hypothetical protein